MNQTWTTYVPSHAGLDKNIYLRTTTCTNVWYGIPSTHNALFQLKQRSVPDRFHSREDALSKGRCRLGLGGGKSMVILLLPQGAPPSRLKLVLLQLEEEKRRTVTEWHNGTMAQHAHSNALYTCTHNTGTHTVGVQRCVLHMCA